MICFGLNELGSLICRCRLIGLIDGPDFLSGVLRDSLEFGHPSQDNVSIDEHSHALTPFIGTNDKGPDQVNNRGPCHTNSTRLQAFAHLWHSLKEVSHEPVVCHPKNRGFGVLVDSHNHFRVFHTGQVLDST